MKDFEKDSLSHGISRRGFLSGSALALGSAAAASLVGCAPKAAAEPEAASEPVAQEETFESWLGEPPVIEDSEIIEEMDCEIAIVGSGTAGLLAGMRAVELGAKTVMLEKHFMPRYGGADWSTMGSELQKSRGIPEYTPEEIMWDFAKESNFRPDLSLSGLWAQRSGEMLDHIYAFLDEEVQSGEFDILMAPNPPELAHNSNINVVYDLAICVNPTTDLGDLFSKLMIKHLQESEDFEVRFSTPAVKLVQDEAGRVTGVIAKNENGEYIKVNASKGVIMCAGDWAGDPTMRKLFLADVANKAWPAEIDVYTSYMLPEDQPKNGEILNTGDGIKMCCWVGATMGRAPSAFCTWTIGGILLTPYLCVNSLGRRFMNEALSNIGNGTVILNQPGGEDGFCWQVFDANYATCGMPTLNLEDAWGEQSGATPEDEWLRADTLEELAELMSAQETLEVNPELFKAEIARYNELCATGVDIDFYKPARFMKPVDTPPFYATKQTPVLALALEGVNANRRCQIVDAAGDPIPGLYGAGNTLGNRFGDTYDASLYGMTCGMAATHGYCAVEFLLEDAK